MNTTTTIPNEIVQSTRQVSSSVISTVDNAPDIIPLKKETYQTINYLLMNGLERESKNLHCCSSKLKNTRTCTENYTITVFNIRRNKIFINFCISFIVSDLRTNLSRFHVYFVRNMFESQCPTFFKTFFRVCLQIYLNFEMQNS